MKKLIELISLTRSLVLLLAALLALTALAWLCHQVRPTARVVPPAVVSERLEASPSLIGAPDVVIVGRRVDSSAFEVQQVAVRSAERYAATVSICTEEALVALGVRSIDLGWFHEFRLRRADPVAIDLLPGYEAEILTVEQRLPLLDVELAPQVGPGLSRQGVSGLVAVTGLRVWGVHLGGFAGLGLPLSDESAWRFSAGGYVSIRPRPGWSVGLGLDALRGDPMFTFTINP